MIYYNTQLPAANNVSNENRKRASRVLGQRWRGKRRANLKEWRLSLVKEPINQHSAVGHVNSK